MDYTKNVKLSFKMRCGKCGLEDSRPGNFCPKCGAAYSKTLCMICWKLGGKSAKKTSLNCDNCKPQATV